MVKWVASKISDLYSDKPKDVNINKNQNIVISWLDSPALEAQYTQYEKQEEEKKEVIEQQLFFITPDYNKIQSQD